MPARVAIQHRGAYDLLMEDGELRASAANRLVRERNCRRSATGSASTRSRNLIEAVLPRRTTISRKETLDATREQILAANIDVAFLVQALPLDFNVRRLERYLAMAWESGAQPVVLLTKTDLVDDVAAVPRPRSRRSRSARARCPRSPRRTGDGLDGMLAWFEGNRTAVLLGSSGVGKSTIVNALAGEDLLATQEVREDDQRGRHTTSHRELILLPTRRRRARHARDPRAAALGRRPRADVRRHRGARATLPLLRLRPRPGARLRDSRGTRRGRAPAERWESYRKLQREMEAIEARRNHLLRQERVREYKIRARANRGRRRKALTTPRVREDAVEFTLPDPEHRFGEVRARARGLAPAARAAVCAGSDGAWRLTSRGRPPTGSST